jgi:integrase
MLIIGIGGACRREELIFLDVKNITDKGSYIIIQIPDSKTNVRREFTISPGNFEGLDLLEIFRTYFSLRPSPIEITRFFLGFRNGKCTRQAVEINTIGGVPKKIADFLNLPNSSNYTGHCFRRTSATLLADAGADITVLKRHGGWRSNTVAEGYIVDSVQNKLEVSSKLLGKEQIINITQSDNVAPKCLLKECNNVVVNIYNK